MSHHVPVLPILQPARSRRFVVATSARLWRRSSWKSALFEPRVGEEVSEEWGRPGMGWGGRPGCPVGTSAPVVVGVIRSACLAAGRPDLPVVASWVVVVLAWSLGPETRDPARRSFPGNIKYRPFGSFFIALALRD